MLPEETYKHLIEINIRQPNKDKIRFSPKEQLTNYSIHNFYQAAFPMHKKKYRHYYQTKISNILKFQLLVKVKENNLKPL